MFSSPFTTLKSQRYIYSHPLKAPSGAQPGKPSWRHLALLLDPNGLAIDQRIVAPGGKQAAMKSKQKCGGKGAGLFLMLSSCPRFFDFSQGPKKSLHLCRKYETVLQFNDVLFYMVFFSSYALICVFFATFGRVATARSMPSWERSNKSSDTWPLVAATKTFNVGPDPWWWHHFQTFNGWITGIEPCCSLHHIFFRHDRV